MANDRTGRDPDRGTRLILAELRDLRVEMRADRRRADSERQQMDAARRKADEAWREERKQAEETRRQDLQRSDERFQETLREFREDSIRREAATQKTFKDIRTVGLSIVKTLNRHSRLLERIDQKLGAWRNGPPRQDNGGRA